MRSPAVSEALSGIWLIWVSDHCGSRYRAASVCNVSRERAVTPCRCPQLNLLARGDDIAKRNHFIFRFGGCCRELNNLGDQLLMDRVHLVNGDMRDVVVLLEIITGIRAPEALL